MHLLWFHQLAAYSAITGIPNRKSGRNAQFLLIERTWKQKISFPTTISLQDSWLPSNH